MSIYVGIKTQETLKLLFVDNNRHILDVSPFEFGKTVGELGVLCVPKVKLLVTQTLSTCKELFTANRNQKRSSSYYTFI